MEQKQQKNTNKKGNIATSTCGKASFEEVSGTSFATPLVAGMAALVRQYLQEGWYPSGRRSDRDAIARPSAALLKAMLVQSTVALRGKERRAGAWRRCRNGIPSSSLTRTKWAAI